MGDSVQGAKRALLNRFKSDLATNRFWVENLAGTQFDHIPFKLLRNIDEFESVVNAVSIQDIQILADLFDFDENCMTSCVGITAPFPPPGMSTS
jgi:hypothetical protein